MVTLDGSRQEYVMAGNNFRVTKVIHNGKVCIRFNIVNGKGKVIQGGPQIEIGETNKIMQAIEVLR